MSDLIETDAFVGTHSPFLDDSSFDGSPRNERDMVCMAMEMSLDDAELPAMARRLQEIDEAGAPTGCDHASHVWHAVPRCDCPKTPNARLLGQALRLVAEHCAVHGQLLDATTPPGLCSDLPIGDGRGGVVAWVPGAPGVRCVDVMKAGEGTRVLLLGSAMRMRTVTLN